MRAAPHAFCSSPTTTPTPTRLPVKPSRGPTASSPVIRRDRPGSTIASPASLRLAGTGLVDLHAAFRGRELELTRFGDGDVHPNAEGYQVIADAIVAGLPGASDR